MFKKLLTLTSLLALVLPAIAVGELPVSLQALAKWERLQRPFHFDEMPGIHLQPVRNPDVTAEIKAGMILEACSGIKDLESNILYFGHVDNTGKFHEYVYDFETKKFKETLFNNEQEGVLRKLCGLCHPFKYPIQKKGGG